MDFDIPTAIAMLAACYIGHCGGMTAISVKRLFTNEPAPDLIWTVNGFAFYIAGILFFGMLLIKMNI